ncbi:PTS sugar transporter subunit IIB [Mediterraneibacter gnavus]|uniref:PTS sugar transporter subunit IIB n=1 Tax=Mediterraneibacter gnavus TaxID=33038 RepID=UPI00232B0043|nr:PTS sugar transporter subunit IIB [Mediterraneibacter gnavus]MDB8710064.1 PTS sugar transporter subunit IIB [Mediterraneibacter gnavus]MDB8713467.1 PTS sugar transporter subunit IIB [Mediterraneibacter gnavus]
MVNLMRVDERLLHGQVAVTWISNVNATSILIANDEVMENEMAKMALKMAKPSGMKLAIRSIEEGAALLNDPRSQNIPIFVIVKTIQDAVRLCQKTDAVKKVNIGGVKKKEGSKLIAAAVHVNEEDLQSLKELAELVEEVEFRMVPSDSARTLDEVLKSY